MSFKEFLLLNMQVYCVLVTLIFATSLIVGLIFAPEQNLRYYHLASPFLMAALCTLPSFITYFKNEPTLKQYIFRHILQLMVIETVVLIMIEPPADTDSTLFYLMIGIITVVIFVLVKLMIWLRKYAESQKLTEQLKQMQKNA